MMEAITGRIAIGLAGLLGALGHHLPGSVFVIRALFFFLFAFRTDRPVIEYGQNSAVFSG